MADIFELFKKISSEKKVAEPISFVIVGLGNPGNQYIHTRHNTGFLAIDYICKKYGAKVNRSAHKGLVGDAVIAGKRVLLVMPQTFMNLSGESVRACLDYYKLTNENLIVIYDDVSLDVGRLRVRRDGSAGGHNGIKSIIEHLDTNVFPRVKVGVGQKPHPDYDLASWVLSEFSEKDLETLDNVFETATLGIEKILSGNIDDAMQICNKKG